MRNDGGPSSFFDHHPAAAFVVLEIGPIAFPCSGHAVMAERGLAVRHARVGRADHAVSAGRPRQRDEDERKAEFQHVSQPRRRDARTLLGFRGALHICAPLSPSLVLSLARVFETRAHASKTVEALRELVNARDALIKDRVAALNRQAIAVSPLIKRQLVQRLRQIGRAHV